MISKNSFCNANNFQKMWGVPACACQFQIELMKIEPSLKEKKNNMLSEFCLTY